MCLHVSSVRVCPLYVWVFVFVRVRVHGDIMQVDRHRRFTDTVCLKNKTKSLQTRYIYYTKTKQNSKFTNTLFLQNKTER